MDLLQRKSLNQMLVADVWPNREITWVSSTCNLAEALELLKSKRVLSLPVVNLDLNRCIGVVDLMDISLFIVASFPSLESITYETLTNLEFQERKFMHESTVFQVIAFSKAWSPSSVPDIAVKANSPLTSLLHIFSLGIHRVPIVDDVGKIINFISQSDMVRFMTQNLYLLSERGIGDKTLDELGIGRSAVYFVRSDAMTLLTLSAMISKKVSAMPILDKDSGRLVGNFSVSDLRGIGPHDLTHLLRPLVQFLALQNVSSLYPLTCRPNDTLEHVILKLAATKVHRLWLVNEQHQLVGVVSLSDVMCPFLGIEPMQQEQSTTPQPNPIQGLFIGGTPSSTVRIL